MDDGVPENEDAKGLGETWGPIDREADGSKGREWGCGFLLGCFCPPFLLI